MTRSTLFSGGVLSLSQSQRASIPVAGASGSDLRKYSANASSITMMLASIRVFDEVGCLPPREIGPVGLRVRQNQRINAQLA
jgi:hypothetical protein